MGDESNKGSKGYGKFCVFLSRSCGAVSSIIVLLCGFTTLLPLPTSLIGSYGRCIATGLFMILSAVIMFFLEVTVLGVCVDKLSFLLKITKYVKNWMRAVLYIFLAFIPIILLCVSASTLVGLGVMFMVGALNFIVTIGTKGDHAETYERMRMSNLGQFEEAGLESGELTEDEEEKTKLKSSEQKSTSLSS